MTVETAVENAVRLLQQAEMQTDHAITDALTRLAEAWTALAAILLDQ